LLLVQYFHHHLQKNITYVELKKWSNYNPIEKLNKNCHQNIPVSYDKLLIDDEICGVEIAEI